MRIILASQRVYAWWWLKGIAFQGRLGAVPLLREPRPDRSEQFHRSTEQAAVAGDRRPAGRSGLAAQEPVHALDADFEGKPGEVTLFTSKGAGHTWPGGHLGPFLRLLLGRTSTEIDATAKTWAFDRTHAGEA